MKDVKDISRRCSTKDICHQIKIYSFIKSKDSFIIIGCIIEQEGKIILNLYTLNKIDLKTYKAKNGKFIRSNLHI